MMSCLKKTQKIIEKFDLIWETFDEVFEKFVENAGQNCVIVTCEILK